MRLSLERLMAAAGHELKTPTAAIHNYLQLVERRLASGDTDEAATYAARAVVQAQRLNELIERLYDVSRIQTGQLEIVAAPIDLVAVVREAVDAGVRPARRAADPSSTPARPRCRSRATPAASSRSSSTSSPTRSSTPTGTGVDRGRRPARRTATPWSEVRDHGPGIAAEDLAGLFEAYTRAGHPRETGLGLGLFVAREIVTAHAGIDHGDVRDRRRDHVHRPPAGRARRPPGPGRPRRTPRVVIRLAIVEDHPALADGLAALIRGSSDVEVVGTAPDVAAAAPAHRPGGARRRPVRHPARPRRRRLRARRPLPPKRPAFIMLTVAWYPSYHARAVDLGAPGYLSKMASVDEILDAIRVVAAGGTAYPERRPSVRGGRAPDADRARAGHRASRRRRPVQRARSPSGCRSGSRPSRASCAGCSIAMTSRAGRRSPGWRVRQGWIDQA